MPSGWLSRQSVSRVAFPAAMHILILTERFVPEVTAPSYRLMEHARIWRRLGHEVTVVTCAPNFPRGKLFDGYRNRLHQTEWIDGVRVVRVWSLILKNAGTLRRIIDYTSYMASTALQALRYPKFDVICASSPPLFVALAGYWVARARRRPWVFEMRDMWPEAVNAFGKLGGRFVGALRLLEEFLYRKAHRIVSLSPAYKTALIERGFDADKQDVVPNGVNLDVFNRDNVKFDARERLGIASDKLVFGHIGTMGMAHNLGALLDVAARTRDDDRIVYLLLGEGSEREMLERRARGENLHNVVFHDFVPRDEMPTWLAAQDVSIVHVRPHRLFERVIPTKLSENLAVGVPMIYACEGVSAEVVRRTGTGICVAPGDVDAIAAAVRRVADDAGLRRELGDRGPAAARAEFSREAMAMKMLQNLELAIEAHRHRRKR
jgi:glycosyltransferase involved in cell wall biosynthesis